MHGEAWGELAFAREKADPALEHPVHHGRHVVGGERMIDRVAAHMRAGGILHLGFLQMVGRRRKHVVPADMVVMQMGDDHVLDLGRVDADHRKPLIGRAQQAAPAPLGLH